MDKDIRDKIIAAQYHMVVVLGAIMDIPEQDENLEPELVDLQDSVNWIISRLALLARR